ncbi:MAG: Ig-like domain-containing protein [Clostridiales bacterium]|nr:Ig-like domain-containing protein [Clostridiales bacterium]
MFQKLIQNKQRCILLSVVFVIAVTSIVIALRFHQSDNSLGSVVEISAEKDTGHGIETDTNFLITCSAKVSEQQLRNQIAVTPDITYTLKKKKSNQYLLKFDKTLSENSIVSFLESSTEKAHSWAFQTEHVFQVTKTLPTDRENGVPVNSGIEISFSFLDVSNFEKCFHIEPSVKGKFETHGKTFVFVPDSLKPNTLYKIKIDKDLNTDGGEKLKDDYTFSFRTQSNYPKDNSYFYISGEAAETFAPDVTPVIEVGASEHYSKADFLVQIYKYKDADAYLNALKERHEFNNEQLSYDDYFTSTNGLEKISSFSTKIKRANPEETWSSAFFVFPDRLPEGQYLIDISAKNAASESGGHLQKFVQINPYAVYEMSVNGEELLWVNDTKTGKPVANAQASINEISSKTGSDGIARFQTPDIKSNQFAALKVKGTGTLFATELSLQEANNNGKTNEQYYTYIYTDRAKYQPTDTISIWGVVLSKDGKSKPPLNAELQLDVGAYDKTPIKTNVTLDASGAFSGKIAISGLASGTYGLKLASGDVTYCDTNVDVGEYVKPSYLIETSFDKPAYFKWQPINLSGAVSFFDGTPAGNMPFEITTSGLVNSNTMNVKSDADGKIHQQIEYPDNTNTWYPQSLYYSIKTSAAEDVQSEKNGQIIVLPRDVMVQTALKEKNDGFSIDVETNRIDLSNITNSQDVYSNDYKNIKGDPVSIPVSVKIMEATWNKVVTGHYYDYINKVSVPKYEYKESQKQIAVLNGKTVNGKAVFDRLAYKNSREKYYYAVIECKDTKGSKIIQDVYFYAAGYPNQSDMKDYRFSHDTTQGFAVGDSAKIKLLENDRPSVSQGKLIYVTVQNNIKEAKTVDAPSFDYTFQKMDIPNIQMTGAYFDGKNIYPVSSDSLTFNPEEMKLNVKIDSDKETFEPGNEVKVGITITDKNNKPVKGAAICTSVVDEAAFAVADQNADPLNDIYSRYFYPNITTYASYVQHDFSGISRAEGGGEGGSGNIRKNFLDTAAFLTATTNQEGRADLTFKLPDNLTSWRVTSLAVAQDASAGNTRMDIKTTKPFFADLLVNKVFLKGDTLSASVRGFGTGLKSDDSVSVDAILLMPDGSKKNVTSSGKTGSYQNLNFGTGAEGDYTLTIHAKSGAYNDSLQKTFRVLGSALEIPVTKTFSLSSGVDINALRSPVTLAFFDRSDSLYNECLQSLASGCGVRTDIRVGRAIAQKRLKEIYGKDLPYYYYAAQTDDPELGSFQDYSGGAKLLEYSGPQTELTAMLCAAAPEYLNMTSAALYLNNIINNKDSQPTDIAAAYMGLAALHQPVLLDVEYLLENEKSLGLKEKLYLTAALALIGDTDAAIKKYNEIVAPLVSKNDPWIYLKSGGTKDDDIECTAIAAITALKTGNDSVDGMLRYIIHNSSSEVTTCLEQLFYVQKYKNKDEKNASFSYMENGTRKTVSIEKNKVYMLSMTTDELKSADFKTVSGDLSVCASYSGGTSDVVNKNANFVSIKKSIEPVGANSIVQSGLVKITLTPVFSNDAPKGLYELSDYILSGMRYVSCADSWNSNWWMEGTEGQKINFSVENIDKKDADKNNKKMLPIVYYARATLSGNFISDSAFIKHTDTAAWGMSERKEISIREK